MLSWRKKMACRAAWVAHVSVISDTGLPISGSPLYKIPATQSSHCPIWLCNMKFTRQQDVMSKLESEKLKKKNQSFKGKIN